MSIGRRARLGTTPRVVVVTRPSEYERLLQRHATAQQAAFFLRGRGQSMDAVVARHERFAATLKAVLQAIPVAWRRARVLRDDLDRFLFEPRDIVLALGQDGLVANLAKYLEGQPVIGINSDPERCAGVLVPHPPEAAGELMHVAAEGGGDYELRAMVRARLDGGQELVALNEIFVGHRSHQSATYDIEFGNLRERHSSSGLIVASGTGATGWARSIARQCGSALAMPLPGERRLIFFVREPWPSLATGTECSEGLIGDDSSLVITSRMEDGVIFGDGIEVDRIDFGWGCRVELTAAVRTLKLML